MGEGRVAAVTTVGFGLWGALTELAGGPSHCGRPVRSLVCVRSAEETGLLRPSPGGHAKGCPLHFWVKVDPFADSPISDTRWGAGGEKEPRGWFSILEQGPFKLKRRKQKKSNRWLMVPFFKKNCTEVGRQRLSISAKALGFYFRSSLVSTLWLIKLAEDPSDSYTPLGIGPEGLTLARLLTGCMALSKLLNQLPVSSCLKWE